MCLSAYLSAYLSACLNAYLNMYIREGGVLTFLVSLCTMTLENKTGFDLGFDKDFCLYFVLVCGILMVTRSVKHCI